MADRLMTSAEMDACERRWKWLLFVFAATLVVDLVYLQTVSNPSLARFFCWLLAVASGIACIFVWQRLQSISHLEATAPQSRERDPDDVVDVIDTLTDICSND